MITPSDRIRLQTVQEVADALQVDCGKVLRWLASGELRGVDVSQRRGGRPRWRIRQSDLAMFLDARASAAAPMRRRNRRNYLPDVPQYV